MTSRDFYSEDAEREDAKRECARMASALTALFDAEADEAETRLAESHLESCARCAWIMQSWTHSRYLLRRLPVPEVPPGLLMRVLLAVRLMSFNKRGAGVAALPSMSFDPKAAEARDARLLVETLLMSGAHPFAPRRSRKAQSRATQILDLPPLSASIPRPPADLQSLILSRTVGRAPQIEAPVEFVSEACEVASQPLCKPLWAASKSFSAFLLPVAAAWMFLLVRVPEWAETVNPAVAPTAVSALTSPERAVTRASGQPVLSRAARKAVRAPFPESKIIIQPISVSSAPEAPRFAPTSLRREEVPNEVPLNAANNETGVVTSSPSALPTVPVPNSVPVATPQPKIAQLTSFPPAISVGPRAWRARPAAWTAPNVPALDERASQWHGASRHAMSPAASSEESGGADALPAAVPDDAPDAAEILDHVARLADSRPDDVRDVMDDFRAALLVAPDETPDASAGIG